MPTRLYLDTARLGRMCPEAQAADRDFARLASEEGCSLYFEQFLRRGYTCLPPSLARRYGGLSFWSGVPTFKRDLKTVLALPLPRQVFLANRSAQLVRLAARLLCLRCENILVTDMEWPAYLKTLACECQRMRRVITTVPVRQALLQEGISQEDLVSRLAAWYRRQDCDGLFLSAVTYQGVRLPLQELVAALGTRSRPRLVVVDGAQALNHVPLALAAEYGDFLLAGCHKWLRAYHPLGLALCCRPSSQGLAAAVCEEMLRRGELDDPLLSFTAQLETDCLRPFSETVNLAPMFTAAAAVHRMLGADRPKRDELACQIGNANRVAEQASGTGWQPIRPASPLRTGILLLQSGSQDAGAAQADTVRERFLRHGIALTTYEGGTIRASLPDRPMRAQELGLVRSALSHCA